MKLSETLQLLLEEHGDQPLSLGLLIKRTEEHGFGMITGILVLPMLIPIPVPLPGLSTVVGTGIVLMGWQLMLGRQQPELPARIAKLEFSPAIAHSLLQNLTRVLHPLERLSQPRMLNISQNPLQRRLLGICMIWNATLMGLPLPIPFTNMVPGYAILSEAIGLLESDGLLILLSYGMTLATTIFFASLANVIWALIIHLWDTLPIT